MAYKALYRTYRPKNFKEVAGQKHIVKTLENTIQRNQIAHAYLFCGPRGTGKTSTAKIFARAINCNSEHKPCGVCENCLAGLDGTHPDIIEIDAASNNGVEEARNLIEKVKYAPIKGKYKIYIIDEVHMMSTGAFNALLKTIEEPPAHVIFILATTEPHKVIPTILSRCQRFDFTKISKKDITGYLETVVNSENIKVDEKVLESIATLADGGMRDALSILDQCRAYSPDHITLKDVNEIYGIVSTQEICDLIETIKIKDTKKLIQTIEYFDRSGSDIKRLTSDIIEILKESVVYDYAKDEDMLEILSLEQTRILKENLSTKKRLELIDILMDTVERYRTSANVISYFEIGMLKIMNSIDDCLNVSEKVVEETKEIIPVVNKKELQQEVQRIENPESYIQTEVSDEDYEETLDNVSKIEETKEVIVEVPVFKNPVEVLKKEKKTLSMDFVLSLLVGANKPEKAEDIEKLRGVNQYLYDIEYGKYANLLKNKQIIASAPEYMVLSVDSQAMANEINELDEKQEFLYFTKQLLKKRKKVFAITKNFAVEAIAEYKKRSAQKSLPEPISFDVSEKKEEVKVDKKLEKITSYFGNITIMED